MIVGENTDSCGRFLVSDRDSGEIFQYLERIERERE